MHTYNNSTGEAEAGEPAIQGYSPVYSEFETRLDYMRHCPKKERKAIIQEAVR